MWTTSDHASSSPHRRLKRLSNAPPGDALFAADFQNFETAHRHHVKPALLSALSRSQHSPCSAARSPSQLHVCLAAALQTSQRLSSGQSFTSGGRWPGCSSGHVLVGPCLSRRNQNSPGMDLTRLTVRATSSLVGYHHIICSKFILGGIRASAMEFVSEHRRLYRSCSDHGIRAAECEPARSDPPVVSPSRKTLDRTRVPSSGRTRCRPRAET